MATVYLIAGRSHPKLKEELLASLNKLTAVKAEEIPVDVHDFACGEVYCRPTRSLRGKRVFILQTANQGETNQNLMELFVLLNAVKLASPEKIYLIVPHLPYSRQERKEVPRAPISAAMLAEIFTKVCNINTLITFDMHSAAIEGYYATLNVPVAHLTSRILFYRYFQNKFSSGEIDPKQVVFVAPDFGRLKMARRLARDFQMAEQVTAINKIKHEDGSIENIVFGECSKKYAIIIDDIIDRGTSILTAIQSLKDCGVQQFYVAAVHGLFSENALIRLQEEPNLREVVITNTIFHASLPPKIVELSVAPLLAEVMKRIILNESLKDYQMETV